MAYLNKNEKERKTDQMRIVGYIEHPSLKITVFQMDNKWSIKFENGQYEQVYKFRSGEGVDKLQDAQELVNQDFIEQVQIFFTQLHQLKMKALAARNTIDEEEFEEII